MELKALEAEFSVCKLSDYNQVDLTADFIFIGKTDEENSLVCPTQMVPDNAIARDDNWRALRIQGVLDFSLVGILSKLATLLAAKRISIFALSTFNTDYILIKSHQFDQAVQVLRAAGYQLT